MFYAPRFLCNLLCMFCAKIWPVPVATELGVSFTRLRMVQPKSEQLIAEIDELLRSMPTKECLMAGLPEGAVWRGRAAAVLNAWDPLRSVLYFEPLSKKMATRVSLSVVNGLSQSIALLHQARYELCLKTQTPLSINVATGSVFDYFDEVRKTIETATKDLFFVDPYLDADFVSSYLPHVKAGVSVRLLARERIATLMPAVEMFRKQSGLSIEVRSSGGFHDRYFLVDGVTCYQSGASFKDGARKAPTTLTQILDAFPAVRSTYESLWASGKTV